MVLKKNDAFVPPIQPSMWRSEPCYSLSWQVGEKWHFISGDCVEVPLGMDIEHLNMRGRSSYGINLVLSGEGIYVDWEGNKHVLRPGVVYQRLPEKEHKVQINNDVYWSEVYLSIRTRTIRHLYDLGLVHVCPVYYVRHPELILKQYAKILDILSQANTAHVPTILVHIQNLLMSIHENTEQDADPDPYRLAIADACAILDCDLEIDIDIESVADQVGMAYETFRKAFKQRRGISPGAYRIRKRLERSCVILRSTGMTINQVAEILGYSDGFSYSAQFKKIIGMSPSSYRIG
ncbi:MAG: helix-turn-helix transcriptional regulator [Planctomycetes bacterium]|nr:helix-turn-helix transcriptional regulator [Planctomycetota bacterium]